MTCIFCEPFIFIPGPSPVPKNAPSPSSVAIACQVFNSLLLMSSDIGPSNSTSERSKAHAVAIRLGARRANFRKEKKSRGGNRPEEKSRVDLELNLPTSLQEV